MTSLFCYAMIIFVEKVALVIKANTTNEQTSKNTETQQENTKKDTKIIKWDWSKKISWLIVRNCEMSLSLVTEVDEPKTSSSVKPRMWNNFIVKFQNLKHKLLSSE